MTIAISVRVGDFASESVQAVMAPIGFGPVLLDDVLMQLARITDSNAFNSQVPQPQQLFNGKPVIIHDAGGLYPFLQTTCLMPDDYTASLRDLWAAGLSALDANVLPEVRPRITSVVIAPFQARSYPMYGFFSLAQHVEDMAFAIEQIKTLNLSNIATVVVMVPKFVFEDTQAVVEQLNNAAA